MPTCGGSSPCKECGLELIRFRKWTDVIGVGSVGSRPGGWGIGMSRGYGSRSPEKQVA